MSRFRAGLACAVVVVLAVSVPALARAPIHSETDNTPLWGYKQVDELLQKVGPEMVERSGCIAGIVPISQKRDADGKYYVSSGLRLACEDTERSWAVVHWEIVAKAGDRVLFEDSDTDVRPENPWNPIGGTQKLSNFSLSCKTVNQKDRGRIQEVTVNAFLSVTDTESNFFKTSRGQLVDTDSVVCPTPL